MHSIMNFIKGIILGVGIVIPGVSGGALAVVFNIYHKLLYAMGHFFEDVRKNITFLFPIGLGGLVGILAFSALIQFLLTTYLAPTNFFFIGLILGGIPSIVKSSNIKKIKLSNVIVFLMTVLLIVYISNIQEKNSEVIITQLNLTTGVRLFLGGVLGAGTMMIPGASGAVMLILLGLYQTVLTAVVDMNILIMIPFSVGALVGLVLISRMVELLFKKFPTLTYSGIIGLLCGSIYMLYPGIDSTLSLFICLTSLFLGMTIALILENIEKA